MGTNIKDFIKDLSPEALNNLRERLLSVARDYEPWADMMYWSGGGDHGVHDFPLDINQIERIDITVAARE